MTRFWLFGAAVRKMLTIALLSKPAEILVVEGSQPMPKQQYRLRMVHSFFADGAQMKQLKVSVLCLRLTQVMLSITAKKPDPETPMLMILSKTHVQQAAGEVLYQILSQLDADPDLDRVLAFNLAQRISMSTSNATCPEHHMSVVMGKFMVCMSLKTPTLAKGKTSEFHPCPMSQV